MPPQHLAIDSEACNNARMHQANPEKRASPKLVMLSCRITDSLRRRLKLAALQSRTSMVDLVRDALEARLNTFETGGDRT